ncbi:site-specific integrase [Murinocardiopsis flavida]|nr:tyrosine-type recombinase/integrase [Murinocardiopsis flavida]
MDKHWKRTSALHRRDRAKILANATMALLTTDRNSPSEEVLRAALRNWVFNTAHRDSHRPADIAAALDWVGDHVLPVESLEDSAVIRAVLERITSKVPSNGGGPLAPKPAVKARRILSHVLDYAVELGHLQSNPLHGLKWRAPKTTGVIDRRSVPNPQQARALLDEVGKLKRSGYLLRPFFAVIYLAGLRPEEAVSLRWTDIVLPEQVWDEQHGCWVEPPDGWGEITVRQVAPDVGRRWTDTGKQRDLRQPKGRAENEDRPVPCSPKLSLILRAHREQDRKGPDGLVFFGEHGGQLATCTYQKAWQRARRRAFSDAQFATPLAKRIYDLRHACVSTWLNEGINSAQIAEWAGHSLEVLLRIYAKCLDGGEDDARRKAEKAFDGF